VNDTPQANPSTFVTTLAWVLIALNGLGVCIVLMQNVMIQFVMPTTVINSQVTSAYPFVAIRAVALGLLLFLGFMTYASYALLKRRRWARVAVVVVFGLSIVWGVISVLILAFGVVPGRIPANVASDMPPDVRAAMNRPIAAMAVTTSIFTLGITGLLGWLVRRLCSASVKAEFDA
jgi:hypothetical protein